MSEGKMEPHARIIMAAPLEHPIEFRIEEDDPKFPGKMIMGAYVGGKLLARRASDRPPPEIEKTMRLKGRSILKDIRPLIYTGIEETVGGNIAAALSIPSIPMTYEEFGPDKLDRLTHMGINIRAAKDRKFLDNIAEECADHLTEILSGQAPAPLPDKKLLTLHRTPLRPGPLMCPHNQAWRTCGICRS